MIRKIISIILMVTVVATSLTVVLTPQPVKANVITSSVAKFGGCFVAGVLTPVVQAAINAGISAAKDQVKNIANQYAKDFLGGILGGFLTSVPTSDNSVASTIGALSESDKRNAIITRCVALTIMTQLTNNTLQIVRTYGRDGGSTQVLNWTNFQTNAQYRGENIFRAELSTANLCNYLSNDIKQSYGVDPNKKTQLYGQNTRTNSLQPFSLQTNCTMPSGFTTQKYQQDFAGNGGWATFGRYLEPQNNIYGLTALSLDEAQKQRSLAEQADVNQVLANRGYTGVSGNGKADSCQVMGPTGQCLAYKDIKTSGDYLAQSVGATIGAQYSWLTSAQGLNTVIADSTEVMLNRLLDFGSSDEGSLHTVNYSPTSTNLVLPGGATPTPSTTACINSQASTILSQSIIKTNLNLITVDSKVTGGKAGVGVGVTRANLVASINDAVSAARAAIATDNSQVTNDQVLSQITPNLTSLLSFIDSDQNDGTLTAKNQVDSIRSGIIGMFDSLTSQPICTPTP